MQPPVRRQSYLYKVVVFDPEIFAGRHSHGSVGRKFHDALVRGADAQFVFGAEHAQRFDSANLAALDLELLVAAVRVEHGTHRGAQHLEAGAAVGCSAHDLQRLRSPRVDRRNVQMVRIGVVRAGQDFADDHAAQPAPDGLDLLETLDFESDVREDRRNLFGRQIDVDVAFEPVIGDIHRFDFFSIGKLHAKIAI